MVDWQEVAAFIGPLVTAIGLVAALYAYMSKQRERRTNEQIKEVTNKLESNLTLLQTRIDQLESVLASQTKQLERQSDTLLSAMQTIARIEGRLLGTGPGILPSLPTCYKDVTVL